MGAVKRGMRLHWQTRQKSQSQTNDMPQGSEAKQRRKQARAEARNGDAGADAATGEARKTGQAEKKTLNDAGDGVERYRVTPEGLIRIP